MIIISTWGDQHLYSHEANHILSITELKRNEPLMSCRANKLNDDEGVSDQTLRARTKSIAAGRHAVRWTQTTTATATGTSLNKRFQSRTMAVLVRYDFWYISLLSSAKQQREMAKFCLVWRTWNTTAILLKFYFKFIAVSQIQFRESFDSDKQSKWLQRIARFFNRRFLGVAS